MPQIAQISEIFASQLFWLAVTFGLIYLVIGRGMVPKISATVEQRDRQISDDLAAAERARADADAREEAYRAHTNENRAKALEVVQAAKGAAARSTEQRLGLANEELDGKVAAAEAQIRAATDAALADIEMVAADAAQDMVAKLSGAAVTRDQAHAAVRQAMANG